MRGPSISETAYPLPVIFAQYSRKQKLKYLIQL